MTMRTFFPYISCFCFCIWISLALASEPSGETLKIKPITERPCLLMGPSDRPRIKANQAALPRPWPEERRLTRILDAWLSGNNKTLRKQATDEFMAWFREFHASNPRPLSIMRRTNEMNYAYDIVVSFGLLTEAEKTEFRDKVVEIAKKCIGDDPATFPSERTPNPWGREWKTGYSTSNRWTDQFLVAGLVGLNFPEHPLAKAWVSYAIEQTGYQLEHGVSWEGGYEEAPRYHNWNTLLYAGWFQALKRRTGIDFFQHPKTKQMLDWYIRFSSPLVRFPETMKRNPRGEPTLPAWGASNYGPLFEACAIYAPQYVKTDPAFSKRLMWMWRRAGSPIRTGQHLDLVFPIMADPTLPDRPQVLGSAFCRTPGYVLFRSRFNTPDETVVTMRAGDRSNWHNHSDLGSVDLFSHGMPLVLRSQSGHYDEKQLRWNRSQQASNVVVFGGKSRSRFDTGETTTLRLTPQVDYAVADLSSKGGEFSWRRHLLLVKDPDYVVMWDELASDMPAEYYLHTTAERFIWEDHRIVSRTAYDADLAVHVLLPTGRLVPREKRGRFGQWIEAIGNTPEDKSKKRDPYPFFYLKYLILSAEPNQDFLTVLHPKRPNEAPASTTLISASEQAIELQILVEDKEDIISLSTKDGASFKRLGEPERHLKAGLDGDYEPGARFMSKEKR